MTTKSSRHKWRLADGIDKDFPGAYAVDECEKCKYLRIHFVHGAAFSKSFLLKGTYHDKTPVCNP